MIHLLGRRFGKYKIRVVSSNETRMRAEPLNKTRVRFRSGGKGKTETETG
jgi:hypothetical protein